MNTINCKNCGNEILEDFGTCPYCKTPINSNMPSTKIVSRRSNSYNQYWNNRSYNKHFRISNSIATIGIIIGFSLFLYESISLTEHWNQYDSKSTHTYTTPVTSTTYTLKNYQQIYNEYSQKLINAGPTSSINEMADILWEGVKKMANYMYSSKGIDGQYSTYESWVQKLTQVYMNECR